jgi:hypothetical protein
MNDIITEYKLLELGFRFYNSYPIANPGYCTHNYELKIRDKWLFLPTIKIHFSTYHWDKYGYWVPDIVESNVISVYRPKIKLTTIEELEDFILRIRKQYKFFWY